MGRSVLNFGKHSGKSINKLPSDYLRWLAQQVNTDLEYWAGLAKAELDSRGEEEDLEAMADDFLRQFGIDPDSL
jgi:hypothetical protein